MTTTNPEELKQLIEDAAKLLSIKIEWEHGKYARVIGEKCYFEPQNPERGDLMKVATVARMVLDLDNEIIYAPLHNRSGNFMRTHREPTPFAREDHQSLVLAVLRAASAVLHAKEHKDGN